MLRHIRSNTPNRRDLAISLAAAVFPCLFLTGCIRKDPPAKPDGVYTTRGKLEMLPAPGPPPQYLEIHHEKIPEFKNRYGQVTGMDEMIMPFPELAPGLKLDPFKVGDKVQLTFEVYWKPRTRYVATGLKKLPEDTKINIDDSANSNAPKAFVR